MDYSEKYLTFNILSDGIIYWFAKYNSYPKTIYYSKDDGNTWTSLIPTSTGAQISVNNGDVVLLKGNNSRYCYDYYNSENSFSGTTCQFNLEGNIMSLIYGDNFIGQTTISTEEALQRIFNNCNGLISAENLVLPATTLSKYCYTRMFDGCTGLTTAPSILPATTLAYACYHSMFQNCKSLIKAPELPATTLPSYCYTRMFEGCTSLRTAPSILPATTLEYACYQSMFENCKSLIKAPELPATTLVSACYKYMFQNCTSLNYIKCLATNISASQCTSIWVSNVAANGTFVKETSMENWSRGTNGIPNGWAVQNSASIELSTDTLTFSYESSSNTITVTSSNNPWTASTTDSWITINPITGDTGETNVTISVSNNNLGNRIGSVSFTDGENIINLTVKQNAEANLILKNLYMNGNKVPLMIRNGEIIYRMYTKY